MPIEAFTIQQFCAAHGISRATYYNLKRDGRQPREMILATTVDRNGTPRQVVRISREAAAEWRRSFEARADEAEATTAA